MKASTLFAGVVAISVSLAACNVFDGLYEEGGSSDVETLVADARAAIQDGRSSDAVAYLQKAHQMKPSNIEVRVELASALLSHHKIDVMLVSELANEVDSNADTPSKGTGCPDDLACNFDCATMKKVQAFSYKDSKAYLRLEETLGVLEQVDELVSVPLEDLGAEPGNRFLTRTDREHLFDALVDRIAQNHPREKARRLAATLLLDVGITKLSTTLTTVEQSAQSLDVTLFHVERMDGSDAINYCGANVQEFVVGTMCAVNSAAYFTLDMLETRVQTFSADDGSDSSSIGAELVDAGHDLFDGITSELASECGDV